MLKVPTFIYTPGDSYNDKRMYEQAVQQARTANSLYVCGNHVVEAS
jgi:hypothetical protein